MTNSLGIRRPANRSHTKHLAVFLVIGLTLFLQFVAPTSLVGEQETSKIPSNGSSGAVSCLLNLEKSKGVAFLGGDIEGWPFELSLSKDWILSVDGTKSLSTQSSKIVLRASSAPTLKLTFGNTLESSITGKCERGEIQFNRFPDGVSNVTVLPETLINVKPRFFQQIFSENWIDVLKSVMSRIVSGLKFSALLLSFLYGFWVIGCFLSPKFRDEAKVIVGALSTFLLVGGLHYFFKLNVTLIIMSALLLLRVLKAFKYRSVQFSIFRKCQWVDTKLVIFLTFVGQFVSSTDFRTIGLLQTDTYNYRAQVELFKDLRLLDLTGPSEGFGARSIDYSNRALIQLITNSNVAWTILLWGTIWLSLVFLSGRLIRHVNSSRIPTYVWALSMPGLLGLWMEGYLSRFSVAAATVVAVLVLRGLVLDDKENISLVILLASYSFSIVPVFLPLILVLPFWYIFQRQILFAFKIGFMIALLAAPSSLWMRNIHVAFDFANDGILDGIASNIVVPHWNEISFVGQLFGFVSWHGGGVRSPVLREQITLLGYFDRMVINFLPILSVLSIVIAILMIIQITKARRFDLPLVFVLIFIGQFVVFLLLQTSFYVTIMFLITLSPSLLIALYSDETVSSKKSKLLISVSLIACLLTTVVEGSLWLRNPNSKVSVNSYWSDGAAAQAILKSIKGEKFALQQGRLTSDYSFFIRASEIGLTAESNQCVNCIKSSRGVSVDTDLNHQEDTTNLIVVFGNCPSNFITRKNVGAYSLCSRGR